MPFSQVVLAVLVLPFASLTCFGMGTVPHYYTQSFNDYDGTYISRMLDLSEAEASETKSGISFFGNVSFSKPSTE